MNQNLIRPVGLICLLIIAQPAILFLQWGVIPLALVIVGTFLLYKPNKLLHPNIAIFGFYFLWLILPALLNLILALIEWEYVLPWGQLTFWHDLSAYTLLQIELTFLTLYLGCHFLGNSKPSVTPNCGNLPEDIPTVSRVSVIALSCLTILSAMLFAHLAGGWESWFNNYSYTYLMGRQGLGAFNFALIALGNLTVFLLGLRNFARRGGLLGLLPAMIVILPLGYVGGFKSRLMFLVFLFLFPYILRIVPRIKVLAAGFLIFLTMLYLLTLVRTSGYYASPAAFLEMMAGYFNSYPLHDKVVTSREPDFFQTTFQVFAKPMIYLGLVSPDVDFDISVMLTKEFFPDQWNLERGTQQWPIETDMYLNYYGIPFQFIPLFCYAALLSWLFRAAIVRRNYPAMPIYALEFLRVFSTMRGALIPWDAPVILLQYTFLYYTTRALLRPYSPPTINDRSIARNNTDLVYFALCNERQIDVHFSTQVLKEARDDRRPYFKVLKLRSLEQRMGLLFRPAILLAACVVPLWTIIKWVQALLASFRTRPNIKVFHAVETAKANRALITGAVAQVVPDSSIPLKFSTHEFTNLAAGIGPLGVLRCVFAHIRLLDRILLTGPTRVDLLLHARDALSMLMLAEFARLNPDAIFVTDDHYQRWSFILSHRAQHLWIVQHGYLYDNIEFPYNYGKVERLVCRDPLFVQQFALYYEIDVVNILSSTVTLQPSDYGDSAVFLASSAVSINEELALIKALKQSSDAHVIVKLHPHHDYDDRALQLTALADQTVSAEALPDCRVLVVFNSFIEYEYRALGKKTVSIERAGSVEHALEEVLHALHDR